MYGARYKSARILHEMANMKRYEVEVERVSGGCSHSYQPGDKFIINGLDTPDGFCGGAYTTLFPIFVALGSGARFGYEKDPLCKTGMACPDNGNVVFKVSLLPEARHQGL